MNMITKQMYESWMVEHGQRFYRMAYSYMKNEQDALKSKQRCYGNLYATIEESVTEVCD